MKLFLYLIIPAGFLAGCASFLSQAPRIEAEDLGEFKITAYRSVPEQTKPKGFYWTSAGIRVNPWLIAVSQDQLKSGRIKYGDLLYIRGVGFKFVGDCMHKRHKESLDVWVETYRQEKEFHKKFGSKKIRVWRIKGESK